MRPLEVGNMSMFPHMVYVPNQISLFGFRYPDMRTVTNCFVLNLAAADILFALTIPAVAYTRIAVSWQLGDVTCRIIPYVQVREAISF